MTGLARAEPTCRQCGGVLLSLGVTVDRVQPDSPRDFQPLCRLAAECEKHHALELTWPVGQPPPVEALPLLSSITFAPGR